LDIHAIEKGEIREYAEQKSSHVAEGREIFVVWDGARSGWAGFGASGAIGSTIMALDAHGIDPHFLKHFINTQFQIINNSPRGTGIPHVDPEIFWQIEVPLAPLAEQRRIVAKLEKLLSKVESSQKRLDRVPTIIKRFRQSVLAAACSGKLTEDWRKQNKLVEDSENRIIEEVAEYLGGFAYKSPTFVEQSDHQVIRIGNVRPFSLDLESSPVFIPEAIAKETERFRLLLGDVVISMTGTKYKRDYGNAAIVKELNGNLFLNQRVGRLRPKRGVLPEFLLYWLQTDFFRDYFFAGETGNVNQGNVGADAIRKAPIELPSLEEQQEIVRRVGALFTVADRIEARYLRAKAQVDKIAQSILAKAFRGKLAPQDPNDEPASVLLERIRKEKENNNGKSTPVTQESWRSSQASRTKTAVKN
jgi:type I restriction enzyme S subunit